MESFDKIMCIDGYWKEIPHQRKSLEIKFYSWDNSQFFTCLHEYPFPLLVCQGNASKSYYFATHCTVGLRKDFVIVIQSNRGTQIKKTGTPGLNNSFQRILHFVRTWSYLRYHFQKILYNTIRKCFLCGEHANVFLDSHFVIIY